MTTAAPPAEALPTAAAPPPWPSLTVRALPGRTVELQRLDVAAHAPGLWQAVGRHADLWTYIPSGPFADEGAFTAWLAERAPLADVAIFTIIDRAAPGGPAPAGFYFLLNMKPDMGTAEIGLVYGPALSRTTAGTEAFFLLAGHVLDAPAAGGLGYRRLEWRCNVDNTASVLAAERFGFTREGTLRQDQLRKGRIWTTAVFSILWSEWPGVSARFRTWLSPDNFTADGRQIHRLTEV